DNIILKSGGVADTTTGWYDASGDPHAACRAITTAAVNELKQTYGGNLRIYFIKYRKQTQYRDKITDDNVDADVNFDYSYIDSCATYLYDVDANSYKKGAEDTITTPATAEANLAKALADIAADIKSWANKTPAQLCE
ncbi:MAG: hypothetical protein LBE95_03140, partial [Holosporaceae bacterium]|nr:hypothetical protein [Holosporaceae bacterium]